MITIYNRYSAFATLSLLCLILFTCKQHELGDTGFPRVRTLYVEMISDTGAVFKGEIMDIPADCQILDHGFVWTEYPGATTYVEKVSLGSTLNTGEFQASASSAMTEGKKYYFKSFVQTPTLTIFGNEMDFISMGSLKPEIITISPTSGSWRDTIVIHGKHFSSSTYQLFVMFGDKTGQNISSTSTEIKTLVPPDLDTVNCKIGIKFANVLYPSEQVFTLVPNIEVTSIEPTTGTWNTTVKIKGKNLKYAQGALFNEVLAPIKRLSDTIAEVPVPYNLSSPVSDVALKINHFRFKAPQKFTFIPGNIKSITPETGTTGTQVTIKTNNIRTINAKVSINGTDAPVKSKTDSTITVTIPLLSKSGNFPLVISDGSFAITYEHAFNYRIPEVTDFSEAAWGDTLIITGRNFDVIKNWKVYFGENFYKAENAQLVSVSNSTLKVLISLDHYYYHKKLFLEGDNYVYPGNLEYKIPDPVIYEIIGPADYNNTLVTIKGKFFHPTQTEVSLVESGTVFSGASQVTSTSFKCNMPPSLKGSYSIKVSIPQAKNYGGKPAIINNCINWEYPLTLYKDFKDINVYDNSAYEIFPDINSQNFYLKLLLGTTEKEYHFEHNTGNLNLVSNSLPNIYSTGSFTDNSKLYICTGLNYFPRNYLKSFYEYDLVSKTYVSLPDFPGPARYETTGFSFNGKGYIIGGSSYNQSTSSYTTFNEIWQYEINSKAWTLIKSINIDLNLDIEKIQVGNHFYIFNKYNIWKFDPTNNTLENIFNSPAYSEQYSTPQPFFYHNNKIYFQIGSSRDECWEFDLSLKKWTYLFNFPFKYQYIRYSYIVNNKAYLLINTRYYSPYNLTILEFDPSYLK